MSNELQEIEIRAVEKADAKGRLLKISGFSIPPGRVMKTTNPE